MSYTKREREILDSWPTVTAQDLTAMNDLFPHYLFFSRAGDLMGLSGINLWASCCGHKEARPYLTRTQDQEHWTLMDLRHKDRLTCPWCGREVTAIDLSRAKGRKSLRQTELTVLLHAKGDALYADALVLYKDYADEAALTAGPVAWCSSGYRFVQGEVMQVDHQWDDEHPCITYERDKLGRKKLVQEPFKSGSISWYQHSPHSILNQQALMDHSFFRYCGFFDRWQYRPGGARGYAKRFHELISYLTAYSIYPRQIEMLSKAEYWQPIADLVWSRKKNAGAMCWEESDPRKAFGVDKQELAWIMGPHPHMKVLEVRNYVRRHWDKSWDLPFCMDFCNLWGGHLAPMDVLRLAKRYRLDPNRLLRYFDGVFVQNEDYYCTLFEIYRDYLDAAYALGRCMEHSAVLWPEQLYTAHDVAVAELAEKQARTEGSRRAASLKARRLKYEFELDGLRIVFPATAGAIRREGKTLAHCVRGYAERHLSGGCTILFLRRTDEPHTPYITIEMDGNKIRQIHGYHNDTLPGSPKPREVHKEFLDAWLRWLRAGSRRNEDGTPKLPMRREKKKEAA